MASCFQGGRKILRSLAWYRELKRPQERLRNGAFLIEGRRAISQIAAASPRSILEILTDGEERFDCAVAAPLRRLTAKQFRAIVSAQNPQGVAAVVSLPPHSYAGTLPACPGKRILLLDDIQNPGNVGTLVRSAAAFGFDGVLMTASCADPFSPKSVQASAGAVLSLWIRRSDACAGMARRLKERGFEIIAADMAGECAAAPKHGRGSPFVLALGNEGRGLSREFRDMAEWALSVPIDRSRAESLNVSAAGAICMYVLTREQPWAAHVETPRRGVST